MISVGVISTISPGITSLINSPFSASMAADSETSMYPSLILPMHRGLMPLGSLIPKSLLSTSMTNENAPSSSPHVALRAFIGSICCAEYLLKIFVTSSLSESVKKDHPDARYISLRASKLVISPLWAMARGPYLVVAVKGWALPFTFVPVVGYLT